MVQVDNKAVLIVSAILYLAFTGFGYGGAGLALGNVGFGRLSSPLGDETGSEWDY